MADKETKQSSSKMMHFVKVWRDRLAKLAEGRKGLWGITVASFMETTIVPIPIEILIAPVMAASRTRGFIVATVTLAGSVAGAVALYALAYLLFDSFAQPLIDMAGGQAQFEQLQTQFQNGGFWVVFAISVAPVPMQIAALAAGAAAYPLWLFFVAIGISRALRYYGLWLLVLGFGAGVARIFEGRKPKSVEKSAD